MPRKALRVRRAARGFALSASGGEVGASLWQRSIVPTSERVASRKRAVSDLITNGLRRCVMAMIGNNLHETCLYGYASS